MKTLTLALVFILFFVIGCNATSESNPNDQHPSVSNNHDINGQGDILLLQDLSDLETRIKQPASFRQFDNSLPFRLNAEVLYHTDKTNTERIVYKITLDQPTTVMKEVTFSASLDPRMFPRLDTSGLFFSNLWDYPNLKTLLPDGSGETKGLVLSRGFVLDPERIDSTFVRDFRTCFLKVAWKTPDGTTRTEYVQVTASPTPELMAYIEKHRKP